MLQQTAKDSTDVATIRGHAKLSVGNPLLVLQTARETFEFVRQELGELVRLPRYCDRSKALELLTHLKSDISDESCAVDPAEMGRAIARFNFDSASGPELGHAVLAY